MSSIFSSILTGDFSVGLYLLCLLAAGVCGAITALALRGERSLSRSFLLSLVVLPIIVTTVILMVNGNVGTGIAVAGAFLPGALPQRGRKGPGHLRDLSRDDGGPRLRGRLCRRRAAVHADRLRRDAAALAHPMRPRTACGAAYHRTGIAPLRRQPSTISSIVYEEAGAWSRRRPPTWGAYISLIYRIELRDPAAAQEFLDALRCRNGNLEIALLARRGRMEKNCEKKRSASSWAAPPALALTAGCAFSAAAEAAEKIASGVRHGRDRAGRRNGAPDRLGRLGHRARTPSGSTTSPGDGASPRDGDLTITEAASISSPAYENRMITVDAGEEDKVRSSGQRGDHQRKRSRDLRPAARTRCSSPPAAGTVNTISRLLDYALADGDTELDAAVFSRDDLTINGAGSSHDQRELQARGRLKGRSRRDGGGPHGSTPKTSACAEGIPQILCGGRQDHRRQRRRPARITTRTRRAAMSPSWDSLAQHVSGNDGIHAETAFLAEERRIQRHGGRRQRRRRRMSLGIQRRRQGRRRRHGQGGAMADRRPRRRPSTRTARSASMAGRSRS